MPGSEKKYGVQWEWPPDLVWWRTGTESKRGERGKVFKAKDKTKSECPNKNETLQSPWPPSFVFNAAPKGTTITWTNVSAWLLKRNYNLIAFRRSSFTPVEKPNEGPLWQSGAQHETGETLFVFLLKIWNFEHRLFLQKQLNEKQRKCIKKGRRSA